MTIAGPRKYVVIPTSIWREASFRSLTMEAQWLYFAVRGTPTISRAGVTTLLTDLWAEHGHATANDVETWLDELADRGRVVIDPSTIELFAPDVMHHEGVATSPLLLERAISDAQAVYSRYLQERVAAEFDRLGVPRAEQAAAALRVGVELGGNPDLPGRSASVTAPQLRRLRRQFQGCAGRRRLRAEIDLGLHVCPCGETEDLTVDHVIPLARGGTNAFENMQVLCLDCNLRKGVSV